MLLIVVVNSDEIPNKLFIWRCHTPIAQAVIVCFRPWWPASSWEKKGVVLSCNILSEQSYPNKSRGCITKWSRHGNKRSSLLLGSNGRCLVDTDGRGNGKERKADCFSPLSCYRIELEMDHCSNAPTGVFFFLFFQPFVIVSSSMNLNGWWESCNWELQQFHSKWGRRQMILALETMACHCCVLTPHNS